MLAFGFQLIWAVETYQTIHVASLLIVRYIYTQDQNDIFISTTWVFKIFICHFLQSSTFEGGNYLCFILLSKSTLSLWLVPFPNIWFHLVAKSHFSNVILQWFDPPHNMTSHILTCAILNASTYLFTLALDHRRPKPSLALHLCLVTWSSFLSSPFNHP